MFSTCSGHVFKFQIPFSVAVQGLTSIFSFTTPWLISSDTQSDSLLHILFIQHTQTHTSFLFFLDIFYFLYVLLLLKSFISMSGHDVFSHSELYSSWNLKTDNTTWTKSLV